MLSNPLSMSSALRPSGLRTWISGSRVLRTALLALAVFVVPGLSAAADELSGTWLLKVSTAAGNGDVTLVLEQKGAELTGTYKGSLGEKPLKGNVTDEGFKLSFTAEPMGSPVEVVYTGKLEASTLKGDVAFGSLGNGTFSGEKKKAE